MIRVVLFLISALRLGHAAFIHIWILSSQLMLEYWSLFIIHIHSSIILGTGHQVSTIIPGVLCTRYSKSISHPPRIGIFPFLLPHQESNFLVSPSVACALKSVFFGGGLDLTEYKIR